jgi:hypothetical protein
MGTELTITEDERKVCIDAAQLLWKLGVHHPQDAAVAFNFTKVVERLMVPAAPSAPAAQPEFKKVE